MTLFEPVLSAQQAGIIELVLTADMAASRAIPLTGRNAIYITFYFDDTQPAEAPILCFNWQREDEPLALYELS